MAGQLLGRAKQSTPRSPQGARLSARGVDGERACRAIIAVPMNALRNAPKPGCVQRRFDSPWSKGPCNPPTPRQPERHAVVTHVFGTFCYLCVRAGQGTMRTGLPDSNSVASMTIFLVG